MDASERKVLDTFKDGKTVYFSQTDKRACIRDDSHLLLIFLITSKSLWSSFSASSGG